MTQPFVAEVKIFAGNFAPRGWAFCNGQIMAISQNTALFSLIGTFYGGNGTSNFALPNLQGSVPIGQGQGPGLSPYTVGETAGTTDVTLLSSEVPQHTHTMQGFAGRGGTPAKVPEANWSLTTSQGGSLYAPAGSPVSMDQTMATQLVGSQPHNNMMPYLALSFIIALNGVFPPRN
ncbi:MAG: phage tail protein [Rudaea sp.]|uniref:phage tail protein n=1 Tax=unclassified Rudaea TaxID=2627037 RepID=UPI0010F6049E|nr:MULTISPECIES: tail fiber protein [unclassified Rudaea]MBN8887410.1 phage tail protein [Rudaea sp.]MBR0347549.1 phage tail protein [Rudaea sp.]